MTTAIWRAAIAMSVATAGCGNAGKTEANRTTTEQTEKTDTTALPDLDPSSPESWDKARALAATKAFGELEKRSDALPFMFMAKMPAAVLVHRGRIVTEKGAAAAGIYLRDLGIAAGGGPEIDDVLFVVFAFEAWPEIEGVREQAYVGSTSGPEPLRARVERDPDAARVVLHYFLPEPEPPPRDRENDVGAIGPESRGKQTRPVVRATLDIRATAEPGWKTEIIDH